MSGHAQNKFHINVVCPLSCLFILSLVFRSFTTFPPRFDSLSPWRLNIDTARLPFAVWRLLSSPLASPFFRLCLLSVTLSCLSSFVSRLEIPRSHHDDPQPYPTSLDPASSLSSETISKITLPLLSPSPSHSEGHISSVALPPAPKTHQIT